MRYQFVWRGADILALIEEAKTAEMRTLSYRERLDRAGVTDDVPFEEWDATVSRIPVAAADVDPKLVFVHDNGVYMMSNAAKGGVQNGALIFYAAGYNPDVDGEDAYVMGDDFAEYLDIGWIEENNLRPNDRFVIELDPYGDNLGISIERI